MTEYWISADGNDASSGTTILTPWATLSKISSTSFGAGDKIHFRRGDVFYGTLKVNCSAANGPFVKIDSYGNGEFPIISKYKLINPNVWQEYSPGIYLADLSNLGENSGDPDLSEGVENYIIGHLVVDEKIYGRQVGAVSALSVDMDFFSDGLRYLYLKKNSQPQQIIKAASGSRAFSLTNAKLLEVSHIEFVGAGHHNISGPSAKNIWIHDCRIGACGGATYSPGNTRLGNGVQLWYECENVIIENCDIYDSYDAATTFQAAANITNSGKLWWRNCSFRYNKIWNSPYAFEWFSSISDGSTPPSDSGFFKCSFKNNLVLNSLSGWSGSNLIKKDINRAANLVTWQHNIGQPRYSPNCYIECSENIFADPDVAMIGNGNILQLFGVGIDISRNIKQLSTSISAFKAPTSLQTIDEIEQMFSFVQDNIESAENIISDTRYGISHTCGISTT